MTLPAWAKGALLRAITLSAGIAIGVGYERRRAPTHEASAMRSHDVLHRIAHELELDSAQREAIAAILARRHPRIVDFRDAGSGKLANGATTGET